MTERLVRVGRPPSARVTDEEEDLISRIDERVNCLGEHRARTRDDVGDELGGGNREVAGECGVHHPRRTVHSH
jgi:hypothetical protein